MLLLAFMFLCALEDLRKRKIPLWLCVFFMLLFLLLRGSAVYPPWPGEKGQPLADVLFWGFAETASLFSVGIGCGLGLGLMLLSRMSGGAVGMGDGVYFLITGIYLGGAKNLQLFLAALLLAALWGLVYYFAGLLKGCCRGRTKLPFLAFAFLAGLWTAGG